MKIKFDFNKIIDAFGISYIVMGMIQASYLLIGIGLILLAITSIEIGK